MTLICERMFSGTYVDRSTQFFLVLKKWTHNSHLQQWNAYCKNAFFVTNCCQYWIDHLHAEYRWHLFTILSEIPQVFEFYTFLPFTQNSNYLPKLLFSTFEIPMWRSVKIYKVNEFQHHLLLFVTIMNLNRIHF